MATALAGSLAALIPIVSNAAAHSARATSRPDAELVELGTKFDKAYAAWVPLCLKWRELEEAFHQRYLRERRGPDPDLRQYWALRAKEPGETADAALEVCVDLSNLIREIPATTIAGLAVKARLVRFDSFSPWEFFEPERDMDWGPKVFQSFLAELDGLAAGTVFDLQSQVVAAVGASTMGRAAVDPDHELISLCDKWYGVKLEYERMSAADDDALNYGPKSPSEKFYTKNVYPLHKKIAKLRPTTLAGVAAKAKFIKVDYESSDLEEARPFFDELIALEA